MENHYDAGDLVRVSGAFKDSAGTAIDPSVVKFKFKRPDTGAVTTYTYGTDSQLVKDSVGNYHVDVSADAAGAWRYRFYSTGTGQAAEQGQFFADADLVV